MLERSTYKTSQTIPPTRAPHHARAHAHARTAQSQTGHTNHHIHTVLSTVVGIPRPNAFYPLFMHIDPAFFIRRTTSASSLVSRVCVLDHLPRPGRTPTREVKLGVPARGLYHVYYIYDLDIAVLDPLISVQSNYLLIN